MSARVIADRYPVPVVQPDGTALSRARVAFVDADGAHRLLVTTAAGVWQVDVEWFPARSWAGSRHVQWRIATDAGDYLIDPGAGCRCGRLGHWQPFDGPQATTVGVTVPRVIQAARDAVEGVA